MIWEPALALIWHSRLMPTCRLCHKILLVGLIGKELLVRGSCPDKVDVARRRVTNKVGKVLEALGFVTLTSHSVRRLFSVQIVSTSQSSNRTSDWMRSSMVYRSVLVAAMGALVGACWVPC